MTDSPEQNAQVPPWDAESEACVLATCLYSDDSLLAVELATETLRASDFARPRHQQIFTAICDLYEQNAPVHPSSLAILLEEQGKLEEVGGKLYLADLRRMSMLAKSTPHYARKVLARSLQRTLIGIGEQITQQAYQADADVAALIAAADAQILAVEDRASGDRFKGLKRIDDAVALAMKTRKAAEDAGIILGYRPTLAPLRSRLVPLVPSNYVVIGGEASLGKSVLGLQLTMEMVGEGAKALFVSVEMSEDLICSRLQQAYGGWQAAANKLKHFPLMILDSPEMAPRDILACGRRAKRHLKGLDIVLVDYMQLLEPGGKYDGDTSAMTAISKGLKRVAKQLGVALIAISSLNRPSEGFAGKAPTLRRFRQSGQIEFDADVAMLLHRPNPQDKTRIDCIIEKQRNGPTGTVPLSFSVEYLWFGPVENDEPESTTERLARERAEREDI